MTSSWRMGRIKKVPVLINPSTLIMAVVLIIIFEQRISQWANTNAYVLGLVLALGLYVSVLFHELSHMLTAQNFGYHVESITLHFLGGETSISHGTHKASHEFFIGFSGPLASAVFGLAAIAVAWILPAGDAATLLMVLGSLNILLASMNLLPALPLDGGRVLRGIVWAITKNRERATSFVAWFGEILAIALVLAVVLAYVFTDVIYATDIAIVGIIAVIIWTGSRSASQRSTNNTGSSQ